MPGDVNQDGAVDDLDVELVAANWSGAGPAGDANADGVVDIFDVNWISANWTPAAESASVAAAPIRSAALTADIAAVPNAMPIRLSAYATAAPPDRLAATAGYAASHAAAIGGFDSGRSGPPPAADPIRRSVDPADARLRWVLASAADSVFAGEQLDAVLEGTSLGHGRLQGGPYFDKLQRRRGGRA